MPMQGSIRGETFQISRHARANRAMMCLKEGGQEGALLGKNSGGPRSLSRWPGNGRGKGPLTLASFGRWMVRMPCSVVALRAFTSTSCSEQGAGERQPRLTRALES